MILYRLLHPDENPAIGLRARDPASTVNVNDHVTNGSRGPASRYISCSRSLEAARRFAGQQQQIVRIEIHGNNPNIKQIIDLTDPATLNMHIPVHNQKGRNFANAFQEVLIEGFIPPGCISVVTF